MEQDDCLSALAEFKQLEHIALPHTVLSSLTYNPARCSKTCSSPYTVHTLQEQRRVAESTAGMLATKCPALRYASFEAGLKATIVRNADGQMKHLLWSNDRGKPLYSLSDEMLWPGSPRHTGPFVQQLAR